VVFVIREASFSERRTPWVANLTSVATARADGLHFDADLTVESSVSPPDELSLRIPRDLTIHSVRTVSDAAVEYRVTGTGSRRTLRIVVPQPAPRQGVFRIRGSMPLSMRRSMIFPLVALPDAAAVTTSWTLQVDHPLEV
jgi:hypothetical protein